MQFTILRLRDVIAQTGLSRSTIYSRISQGLWPKPVNLGGRAVGWPSREVDALSAALIAGQTSLEIRALVEMLHASRQNAFVDHQSNFGNGRDS